VKHHLRIARPVTDIARARDMYVRGLGLSVVGGFEDHEGFDGVMLGSPGADYHFVFTHCRNRAVRPTPTVEDLAVFYIPSEAVWRGACANMEGAGFKPIASYNPYWEKNGRTYEDLDGYRVVLQRAEWEAAS
jgi:catechol 2,3-dioxygenase-like lactoylglutathione lyase family enzyme